MITGEMNYGNIKIGTFQTNAFNLKGGEQFMDADFLIESKAIVTTLVSAIAEKKYPVINVKLTYYLPLFSFNEKFDINMKDFVNLDKFNIFK